MKLHTPNKLRGSWHYSSNKYGYDYDKLPYKEIISDLKIILTTLIESKIFLPRLLEDKVIEYENIEDLIMLIKEDNYLSNCLEFSFQGDTVIYTEQGEEIHSNIFTLDNFRTFQQSFTLSTKSDIWLPMSFNEETYSYIWNLEKYNLNYYRIPSILKKIDESLDWENEDLLIKEIHERGSFQNGYDFFLSKEIIRREFNENPNPNFDLEEYPLI